MTVRRPVIAFSGLAALRAAIAIVWLVALLSCSNADEATVSPIETIDFEKELTGNNSGSSTGSGGANERNGVTDGRILFGQSAAFTGPASDLGVGMRTGILMAFSEANDAGGVHGRTLELAFRDDAYEPEAAIANTSTLIQQDKVFALVGAVGTPTSRSAVPVAAAAGVPYVAPFTGAEFLRSPSYEHILNVRASYYQETAEMVNRLLTDLGITRIAVMYQDDSFGRAGYQGVRIALADLGMEPVAIGIYPRNTKAIKTALLDLRQGRAGSGNNDRRVRTGGAFDFMGSSHRLQSGIHDGVVRRQQRLGEGVGGARKRRLRYAGGTLPLGRIGAHRCRLSKRSANACSG